MGLPENELPQLITLGQIELHPYLSALCRIVDALRLKFGFHELAQQQQQQQLGGHDVRKCR